MLRTTQQKFGKEIIQNNQFLSITRDSINFLDNTMTSIEIQLEEVKVKSNNLEIALDDQTQKVVNFESKIGSYKEDLLKEDYKRMTDNLSNVLFARQTMIEDPSNLIIEDPVSSDSQLQEMQEDLSLLNNIKEDLIKHKSEKQKMTTEMNTMYDNLTNTMLERVQYENYLLNKNKISEKELLEIRTKLERDLRTKNMNSFLVNRGDIHNVDGDKIVEEAKKYLGIPYVYGGVDPKGMDCSGLILLVMNAFNIYPPRVSYDQSKFGKDVSLSDIQPGDVLFFDTLMLNRVSHTGIYIGNGEILHAPKTGDVVKISKLSRYYQSAFINAKRYY